MKLIFIFPILLFTFCTVAQLPSILDLDSITITSSRMELKRDQIPQRMEVIHQRDIQNTTANDVTDYLKKLSSVNIVQFAHAYSYANLRGFAPNTFHGSNSLQPATSVLINGRPAGTINLAVMDRSSIEQIEVLKGPAAAIYGANTMGGVINIITKKSTKEIGGIAQVGFGTWNTLETNAAIGGQLGSGFDFDISGNFFNRANDFSIGSQNIFRNAFNWGNSIVTSLDGDTLETDDSIYDGQKREFSNIQTYSGMVRVGYRIDKNWRIDIASNIFGTPVLNSLGDMRTQQRTGGAREYYGGEASISGNIDNHRLLARFYRTNEKVKTFNFWDHVNRIEFPEFKSYQSDVDGIGFQIQDEIKLSSTLRITTGVDYHKGSTSLRFWDAPTVAINNIPLERAPSSPNGQISNFGLFVQAHIKYLNNRLIINPSIRTDFINYQLLSGFGLDDRISLQEEQKTMYSPNLGIQYNFTHWFSIHGNAGQAFRYAVANQIAGYFEAFTNTNPPRINVTLGNPDLNNETSFTWDSGIRFSKPSKGFFVDITYFRTKVDNRIIIVSDPSFVGNEWVALDGNTYTVASYRTYANSNYSYLSGFELDAYYDFGSLMNWNKSLRILVNGTRMIEYDDFIRNSDPLIADTKTKALHVADLSMGGGIEYDDLKRFSFRLTCRYTGNRFYTNFNDITNPAKFRNQSVVYPPHLLIDLVINYSFSLKHSISLRINNLTDENYYELRYQPLPGRFTQLRYTYKI
jgi:vitamin B12 transporter